MKYSLAASFAAAAKEAIAELDHEEARLGALKDQMEALVMEAVPSAIITASGANRAAHNAHSEASAWVRVTLGKTSTFQDVQRFLTALEQVHPVALQATPA